MKKSLSKKIFAMFLAVLMLVSSVPFVASAADVDLAGLNDSILQYEGSYTDGKVRYNLANSFSAYLTAKKLYDVAYYGNGEVTQTDINAAKTALDYQMALMTEYKTPVVSANAKAQWTGAGHDTDAEDVALAAEYSNKLLYAGNFICRNRGEGGKNKDDDVDGAFKIEAITNGSGSVDEYLQSGDVVMLYDGSTTDYPRYPVFSIVSSWGTKNTKPEIWGIWPGTTSTQDTRFNVNKPYRPNAAENLAKPEMCAWVGGGANNQSWYQDNFDNAAWNYISGDFAHTACPDINGAGGAIGSAKLVVDDRQSGLFDGNAWYKTFRYLASTVQYTGTPSSYAENINITWAIDGYDQARIYGQGTDTIHNTGVLNWKAIKDLASWSANKDYLVNPQNYLTNSADLLELFKRIDYVTGFNPNAPTTYADRGTVLQYSNVADTLDKINSSMNAADNVIKAGVAADSDGYNNLKAQIVSARNLIAGGNTAYTADSWNKLSTALSNASANFASTDILYSNANAAQSSANTLASAMVVDTPYDAPTGLDSKATFADYDLAKASLVADLKNPEYKFTYDSLDALNTTVNSATYFNYDDAAKNNVSHTKQSAVNTEADKLTVSSLTAADSSAYDAAFAQAQEIIANANNADKYNLAVLKTAIALPVSAEITVAGVKCTGYKYDDVTDKILTAINESQYEYTVKVVNVNGDAKYLLDNGTYTANEADAFGFHYGDKVTVTNAEACDWSISVKAAATQENSKPRYVHTGDSYEFFVGGDTVLETFSSTGAPEGTYKVSLIDNRIDEAVAFAYTENGELSLASLNVPTRAFHTVEGFTYNGVTYSVDEVITGVTGDIEVTINYVPVPEQTKYNITVLELDSDNVKISYEKKYNERVVVNVNDAVAYMNTANGKCLWNAPEYVFYANQNVTIKPVSTNETDINNMVNVVNKPVMNEGKAWFVGSFANLPEDCVIIKYGFIVDRYNQYTDRDLTLSMVGNENELYGFKCDTYDEANMFVFILSSPVDTIGYNSYVVYEQDGIEKIAYSETLHNVVVE